MKNENGQAQVQIVSGEEAYGAGFCALFLPEPPCDDQLHLDTERWINRLDLIFTESALGPLRSSSRDVSIYIWEDSPGWLSHQKLGNFCPSLCPHCGLFNHI